MKMKHYLITVTSKPIHLHAYLMCRDDQYIEYAMDRMTEEATEAGLPLLQVFLITQLSTGIEMVREIVYKVNKEARAKMMRIEDYYLTAWTMREDDQDDERLMKLH